MATTLHSAAQAARTFIVWVTGATAAASPTITAGSGAPTASAPNGSIYLRTNAANAAESIYSRIGGNWVAIVGT